jgi:hypothetical protein
LLILVSVCLKQLPLLIPFLLLGVGGNFYFKTWEHRTLLCLSLVSGLGLFVGVHEGMDDDWLSMVLCCLPTVSGIALHYSESGRHAGSNKANDSTDI